MTVKRFPLFLILLSCLLLSVPVLADEGAPLSSVPVRAGLAIRVEEPVADPAASSVIHDDADTPGVKAAAAVAEVATEEAGDQTSVSQTKPGEETETEEVTEEKPIHDPIEPWNRLWFHFNDKLYFWVLKPVAKGYNRVMPEPVRVSIRNFFTNIAMPIRFVNSLLQGNVKAAGTELVRFGINSTAGIGGLFDVAKTGFHIEGYDKDFGQTLGRYGFGEGFYIVWPFLGPSSLRDSVGKAGDGFLYPVSYITPTKDMIAVEGAQYFNDVSLRLGDYEDLVESAVEPYAALKNAYIQHRRSKVKEDK